MDLAVWQYRMDSDIDGHGDRTARLTRLLCDHMGMDRAASLRLSAAARTHDIGKLLLPPGLRDEPATLTREEQVQVRLHCAIGARLLTRDAPHCTADQTEAAAVALLHHEWWNGRGYPFGLAREQIPLSARIVAVADEFDVLMSKHACEMTWPPPVMVLSHIRARRGIQFDPVCVEALLDVVNATARQATFARPFS